MPYFLVTEDTPGQLERNIASEGAMDETQVEEPLPTPIHRTGLMTRYMVAEAKPSHMLPPWLIDSDINGTFTHVQQLDEQPFAYKENLVILLLYFEYTFSLLRNRGTTGPSRATIHRGRRLKRIAACRGELHITETSRG